MNIIDRLEKYMEYKGLNNNKVTVQAGLSIGLIGKAREVRKGLHSDSIEKILYTYEDLNPEWFVMGKGEMIKVFNKSQTIETEENNDQSFFIAELFKLVREKDQKIEDKTEEVGKLKEQLASLKKDDKPTVYRNVSEP